MRLGIQAALWLSLVGLLAGCARTELASYVDPAYQGRPKFTSAVVFAPNIPLKERSRIEDVAVEALAERGVAASRGMDVIPPTRQMTNEQVADAIIARGFEAVLIIFPTGKGTTETYVPPTYHPGTTTGSATTLGNTTYFNFQQSPGYTTGGFNVSKPVASYRASLIDVRSGAVIWTADASSRGSAFDDYVTLGASMARESVSSLVADGLF